MKIEFAAMCRTCNPNEPVFYDDPEKRDHEAEQHMRMTGHTIDLGFRVV